MDKNIEYIEAGTYTGYIWMSDQISPKVLNNTPIERFQLNSVSNPFIIEAQLTDGNYSYSVKQIDGEYIAYRYDLNKLEGEKEELLFIPNRMPSVKQLKFCQYWKEEIDDNCAGMKVLQPKEIVFTGFIYNEKEEKSC